MPFDGFLERITAADTAAQGARTDAAGALAHDLNNLLAVILNANEALIAATAAGSAAREMAELSADAALKAGALLRRLRDAETDDASQTAQALEAVQGAARLAAAALPAGIEIAVAETSEPALCAADPVELDRALLNLCVNAGHAMPDGGALTLSTTIADLSPPAVNDLGLPAGLYAAIAVVDTGVGMTPQVLARATEPGFTTRAGAGGCGLGLAGVRAFAEQAGGRLILKSQEGRGTTATLFLPLA